MNPQEAYRNASEIYEKGESAYMVISDLCGSTSKTWKDVKTGIGLQSFHETLCANISGKSLDDSTFKSIGDGVMMEFSDPVEACGVALNILREAEGYRKLAGRNVTCRQYESLHLKIIVASGHFHRAPNTQKWLGVLPTKASRIAEYARTDEIWVDSELRMQIHPSLDSLCAKCDGIAKNGAAFHLLLRGFNKSEFAIHNLRPASSRAPLTEDEMSKEYILSWNDVMVGIRHVTASIEERKFLPNSVV